MKIFVFALAVVATSLALVLFSQHYIISTTDNLKSILEDVPQELNESKKVSERQLEHLNDALEFWQKRRFKLCLIINRSDFEEVEELLLNLRSSAKAGDKGIYTASYSFIKEKLTRLRKAEALSFEGIL